MSKELNIPTVKWMMNRYALKAPRYANPRIVWDAKRRRHFFMCDIIERGRKVNSLCPIPITKDMMAKFTKESEVSE